MDRAVSSVVEHYVDIVGVTSSNLVPPTINSLKFSGFYGRAELAKEPIKVWVSVA